MRVTSSITGHLRGSFFDVKSISLTFFVFQAMNLLFEFAS